MNEFIEQFLVESRELVEQATADLLALEERPGDRERLDSAFRAFHTLKGAAGIVEFDAMARALHAAEDVLAQVRAGAAPVTPALIGDSLTCLDQVLRWLDAMEPAGEIPVGADAAADALVRRFAKGEAEGPSPAPSAPAGWVEALLARHPDAGAAAAAALRYTPDRDAFFRGEDPLARLAELPGLLALDMASVAPWPPLEALDPFACQLVFEALLASPAPRAPSWWSSPRPRRPGAASRARPRRSSRRSCNCSRRRRAMDRRGGSPRRRGSAPTSCAA